MLGWFQAIMPKEDKFFDLFELHAEHFGCGCLVDVAILAERVEQAGIDFAFRSDGVAYRGARGLGIGIGGVCRFGAERQQAIQQRR